MSFLPDTSVISELVRKNPRGQPLPVVDSLLAATALVHGFQIVTRNVQDFERCGVACVNPWEE